MIFVVPETMPFGVADGIDDDHLIDLCFGDGPVDERIRPEIIRDDDDMFCMHGVRHGIAERTAGGAAKLAGAVAHRVACGGGDEGYVNGRNAGCDVARAAAVGAELNGFFHVPFGNKPAEYAGHIVGLQLAHNAAANVFRKRRMYIEQGACVHGEPVDPKRRNFGHDHVEHMIPVAQVVMEGDGHAALKAAVADGFR